MSQLFKGPPGGGTIGNVTGPASSTDNAIVRWNGITGTLIQDSGVIVNDSDRVTIPVGSSAGLCFGDGDSCLYESSDDVLVLSTAGAPAITLDASQNATLASDIDVAGNGVVQGDLTVGHSTRDVSFTINGAAITASISMEGENGTELGGLIAHRHSSTAGFGGHLVALRSRGTHDVPTVVQSGDTLSQYAVAGYDGTDYALAADILVQVDGTPGANDMPGRIIFQTSADGTQIPVEAMRIDATQTVTLANALPVASGGTGQTSYTNGQLLIGNTTGNTLAKGTLTGGTGITVTNGAGSITIDADNNGDVVGPGSSTDNAIARYSGTTGKLIQDSGPTIDDNGNIDANTTWAGNTRRIGIVNNSNTASSAAKLTMVVGGTSAADMYTEMRVGSSRAWSAGVDNDDSQAFKVTTAAAANVDPSSGTSVFEIDTSGNPTFPANPLNVASGGTGVTSNTAYAVLCGGTTAAGDIQSIAGLGTSGQVLTSNGAAALPTFQDAGGGGGIWEYVSSQTISNDATIDFTGIASGYDYLYVIDTLVFATDSVNLYCRVGTGGTPTWVSGGTDYNSQAGGVGAQMQFTNGLAGNATNETLSGQIYLLNPGGGTNFTWATSNMAYFLAAIGTITGGFTSARYQSTTAVTGFRFLSSSGNLTSGTIREYRRATS